jgi:dsDNA-specific endonuclease/ATPase MutS2
MNKEDNNFFQDPVELPIEDWIDLHTFSPKDIPDVLGSYLEECCKAGLKEVRIIHGKGIGVQREIVQNFLKKSPLIDSFFQAPPQAGGWGATIAILKTKERK